MPTIDWPEALIPQTAQLSLRKAGAQFASPFNGTTQAVDFLAERWTLSASLAQMSARNPRGVDAFCNLLAGGVERVRVWPFHTGGVPRGTARGSMQLAGSTVRGANQLQINGVRAGANLLRRLAVQETWADGWETVNASVAYAAATDPNGGTTAAVVTRVVVGNHYIERTFVSASGVGKSVKALVWLRGGTLSGTVRVLVRDGAFNNTTIQEVTLTDQWALHAVVGYLPPSAAPNIRVAVDPVNDAGAAGETFQVWVAQLEVEDGEYANARLVPFSAAPPTGGLQPADQLVRVAAGDHAQLRTAPVSVAAGQTLTYSCWLRLNSLTGPVLLQIADAAYTVLASASVAPSGSWARFSVTHTFAAPSAAVRVLINPVNDAGSAGDVLEVYGEWLGYGGSPGEYFPTATLEPGDMLGAGGQLFQVAARSVADGTGRMAVEVVNRVRSPLSSGQAVTWYRPTCEMMLPAMQAGPVRRPGAIESTALDLVEVW
jgi:hypothetical protein